MSDEEPTQEDRLLAKLEAKRRKAMVQVTALALSVGGAICGIVMFWAAHDAGVATREGKIAGNSRDIEAMKRRVDSLRHDLSQAKRDALGDGKILIRVQADVDHIKKTLDTMAKRRR